MHAMGFAAAGFSELMVLVLALGGVGLPLGMPPEKEDPNLAFVAPDSCLLYASWSGMAKADPESGNHTEQLLAEPEIARFAAALENSLVRVTERLGESDDQKLKKAAELLPIWTRTILTRPTAMFVTRLAPSDDSLEVEAGLIVKAGANAGVLARSLAEFLSIRESQDNTPLVELTIRGKKFFRLPADPQVFPVPMTFGADGDYFLLSLGEGVIDQMLARIAAKKVPEWLTRIHADLPVPRRASLSYVNLKALRESLMPLAGPEAESIFAALGLNQVSALSAATGLDDDGVVSKSILSIDQEPRGLLKLLDGPGIKAANLRHIRADALFATGLSIDAGKAFDMVDGFVREIGGPFAAQQWEEALQQLQDETGVKVRDDVLAALGPTWTASMCAGDGWFTGAVATVEVRDRAKLVAVQEKLLALNRQQREQFGAQAAGIKTMKHGGNQIYYLATADNFLPVQPAWCITDEHFIVALLPQTVRAILSRSDDEKSLGELPDVASALAGDGNVVAISYYDSKQMFEISYMYVQMLFPMWQSAMRSSFEDFESPDDLEPMFDAAMLPTSRSVYRHLQPGLTVVRRTPRGLEIVMRQTLPTSNLGATAPVTAALLLPVVQAARDSARRTQSANNLMQIGIGLHNHHDTWRGLPAAYSLTKEGKPGLSWRVHLLPYLEQQELYDQFHLDEPWDSEHNRKLIAKIPSVYRSPSSRAAPGMTTYLAAFGKNAIIVPPADSDKGKEHPIGSTFASVVDGLSNTIIVLESTDDLAVAWTKPGDFEPDDMNPFKGLVNDAKPGFSAVLGDGSIQYLKRDWDPKMLKRALQRNDGEEVEFPE